MRGWGGGVFLSFGVLHALCWRWDEERVRCQVGSLRRGTSETGHLCQVRTFWTLAGHKSDLSPLLARRKVTCLSFSPDGKRFVSGASKYIVRIHDAETGAEVK